MPLFNSLGHIMAVGDVHVFSVFLTPVLTQLFFPKPPTTFLKCFCRGERRKYARKKVRLNRDRTHNQQVMSPTRSPMSHPGGAQILEKTLCTLWRPHFHSDTHGTWSDCMP